MTSRVSRSPRSFAGRDPYGRWDVPADRDATWSTGAGIALATLLSGALWAAIIAVLHLLFG